MKFEIEKLKSLVPENFNISGEITDIKPFGHGHINDTFLLFANCNGKVVKYTLQKINDNVFKKPKQVMDNIMNVTDFLKSKLEATESGIKTVNFIQAKSGDGLAEFGGTFWRMYEYIDGAISLDLPETKEDFYESAYAFGTFQRLLSDYPAETLYETIPDFHNTPKRYQNFIKAVNEDKIGRLKDVKNEVEFVKSREGFTSVLENALNNGEIPLRVTHNDTKINNVLLDIVTRKALCVIDLDTIMPGLSVNDFGDSIRFGASTAAEDEKDLSKVHFDISLFETYLDGFLTGCDGQLTENEIELLPEGAKMMTLEVGMRFLTDYLEGDTYFKTEYPEHNLDRCRTQFKLIEEMESNWRDMKSLVRKYI